MQSFTMWTIPTILKSLGCCISVEVLTVCLSGKEIAAPFLEIVSIDDDNSALSYLFAIGYTDWLSDYHLLHRPRRVGPFIPSLLLSAVIIKRRESPNGHNRCSPFDTKNQIIKFVLWHDDVFCEVYEQQWFWKCSSLFPCLIDIIIDEGWSLDICKQFTPVILTCTYLMRYNLIIISSGWFRMKLIVASDWIFTLLKVMNCKSPLIGGHCRRSIQLPWFSWLRDNGNVWFTSRDFFFDSLLVRY